MEQHSITSPLPLIHVTINYYGYIVIIINQIHQQADGTPPKAKASHACMQKG
jgi:hypothetical protein